MSEASDIRVRELLAAATQQPPETQAEFLKKSCGADGQLCAEVHSLLAALREAGAFLLEPAMQIPPTVAAGPQEPPGTTVGRYHLLELIGEGGFGSVYRARQEYPVRREVALKIVKLGMDTKQVIRRFEAERQALAMMDHPNIAKVFDAGTTETGRPYFVMELVEGVPITQFCDDKKLTIQQRLELFIEICQAVQHAHTKGVIHRDLKPSNILVSIVDGRRVPKVIDFGIAKAMQGRLTEHTLLTEDRQWVGTPQYMAPEQANSGGDVDTRSDIYMLGVLLYELLTGQPPFAADDLNGKSSSTIQRIIREVEPPAPSTRLKTTAGLDAIAARRGTDPQKLRHVLQGELDWIIMKCLEKDRKRRFETASALASDLQRYLHDEPVTARQPTRLYRFRKLIRRNRLAFGGGAALALALLAGLGASTWSLLRARDAERGQRVLREDAEAKAYASDMIAVQQALAVYNLGRARMLLDRHRPRPGEKDLRGWEWRYFWQQSRSDALLELCRATSAICSLAVSRDGRLLAIGDEGGGLSVWDLRARKEIGRSRAGAFPVHTAFSPREPVVAYTSTTSDPNGSRHAHVHLWDLHTGTVRATASLDDECKGLAFSADGNSLATATVKEHGNIIFWRIPELTEYHSLLLRNTYDTNGTRFMALPDLSAAAIVTEQPFLNVIDTTTGSARWRENVAPSWTTSLAFSPDGRVLAFSKNTGGSAIHLRDAANGKTLGRPLEGHLAWVCDMVFWPDGKRLASASADQTIRLWDVSNPLDAKPIGRPLRGHMHEVSRLALLPDLKTLVSGAKDGSVCLWDTSNALEDRSHQVFAASNYDFDPSAASTLVSINGEGRVVRHDGRDLLNTSLIVETGAKVDRARIFGVGLLAILYSKGEIGLWDLKKKKPVRTLHEKDSYHWYVRGTPQGRLVAGNPDDDVIREWDIRTGQELPSWRTPGGMNAIAFTVGGARRLTMGYGGTGMLSEMATGRQTTFSVDARQVVWTAFSPNGKFLAIASEYGFVGLWNTADLAAGGKKVPVVQRLGGFMLAPQSVVFSPDGRRLAGGGQGSEAIKLWDVNSLQEVLNLGASGSLFFGTQFSPDGSVLAAMNEQNELHLWRAPTMAEIEAAEAKEAAR